MMKWIRACAVGLTLVATAWLSSAESSQSLLQAKAHAEEIASQLSECKTQTDRTKLLTKSETFLNIVNRHPDFNVFFVNAPAEQQYVLALLVALDQFDTVCNGFEALSDKEKALLKLATTLVEIERFYQPIGGILGYHSTVISLMTASEPPIDTERYLPPPYKDIRNSTSEVWNACYEGVEKLGSVASIFALGGAGDRLNLIDEQTKEALPAARLIFCGRSLFEGLMRDVEAQEYWHYRVFGNQVTMPILIMTSREKNNDFHIEAMGKQAQWFGHRQSAIRRIVQPLVPVIDMDGQWAVSAPLELALKPGGHGVIWKLAVDSGALQWLTFHGIDAAVVRQVNNPLAGLDVDLPALVGYGLSHQKAFGFLSCPSKPGFAEGLNVLSIKKNGTEAQAAISNIEYTQFSKLKNLLPKLFTEGVCPANTNILYINLHEIPGALLRDPIPGMIVNAKTAVDYIQDGKVLKKTGGRLESCMQNIADGLMSPVHVETLASIQPEGLSTFLLLQDREKLMSTAKKAYQPGQNPLETPVSCLYDWHRAMRSLLSSSCHFTLPQEQTLDEFICDGPSFSFAFHPAMGPLWNVIGQKLSGGTIAKGSEVELEIAEIACSDLSVQGSLRIVANRPTGQVLGASGRIYTDKVGRAKLSSVRIENKGPKSQNVFSILKGTVEREESCEIILEGFSEVVASNITIFGDFKLVVPNGQRAILSTDKEGQLHTRFEAISTPSWHYSIEWNRFCAPKLQLKEAA